MIIRLLEPIYAGKTEDLAVLLGSLSDLLHSGIKDLAVEVSGTPNSTERSLVPTKTHSSPSRLAMASTLSSPSFDSIMRITEDAFALTTSMVSRNDSFSKRSCGSADTTDRLPSGGIFCHLNGCLRVVCNMHTSLHESEMLDRYAEKYHRAMLLM